jgi:hypothetical protein
MHISASLTAILLGLYGSDNVEIGTNNKEHVKIEERRPLCIWRQEDPIKHVPQNKAVNTIYISP